MGLLCSAARTVENATIRNNLAGVKLSTVNRTKSNLVGRQALLYIAVFYINFVPDAVSVVLYYVDDLWYYYLDLFAYTILPAQGFLNFIVFLRRRETVHSRYRHVLKGVLCLCCQSGKQSVEKSLTGTRTTNTGSGVAASKIGGSLDGEEGFNGMDASHQSDVNWYPIPSKHAHPSHDT